jgi:hypothetical protein
MSPLPVRMADRWLDRAEPGPGEAQLYVRDSLWMPHVTVAYSSQDQSAEPIIAALGRELPECPVTIDRIQLVAQYGAERAWNWQPITAITIGP